MTLGLGNGWAQLAKQEIPYLTICLVMVVIHKKREQFVEAKQPRIALGVLSPLATGTE